MLDWLNSHAVGILTGATALGIVAHAVNTFPTPKNQYGGWLLGVIQFAVGQRIAGKNTLQGLQTMATGITTAQKLEGVTAIPSDKK